MLAACSGKRNVTVWHLSVRLSVPSFSNLKVAFSLRPYRARYVRYARVTYATCTLRPSTTVDSDRTCANAGDGLKNLALSTPLTAVARLQCEIFETATRVCTRSMSVRPVMCTNHDTYVTRALRTYRACYGRSRDENASYRARGV